MHSNAMYSIPYIFSVGDLSFRTEHVYVDYDHFSNISSVFPPIALFLADFLFMANFGSHRKEPQV